MKSENMIAITGANGYIGRELVKALERENLNYSLLKRTNHGFNSLVDQTMKEAKRKKLYCQLLFPFCVVVTKLH